MAATLKFVCCRYAFFGSGASLHNALSSGRCARRQISFNACNQLWNADRLGKKWICGADRRKRLFWYDLSPIGERHCLWKCREKILPMVQ